MTPRQVARRHAPDDQLSFDLDVPVGPSIRPARRDDSVQAAASAVEPGGAGDPDGPNAPDASPVMSAGRIAALLERPEPTDEQVAVIEADPASPLLVVAGAGSGKTETMAARVVYLVANGLVHPEQVLGLTFTRKAAAEFGDRVRSRLNALSRRGFSDPSAEPVTVSTYHSYAASIVADHGLRLGLDVGSRLISEAGAWQIVDQLVEGWDGEMGSVESARMTVVDAVLALADECAEHLRTTGDIDAVLVEVTDRLERLPAAVGDAVPGKPAAPVVKVLGRLAARRQILPIVEAYLRRKRELEVLDFGDQVALAARLAGEVPEVGAAERHRYRVVLLDEYQDTSHAQLSLLTRLFGQGHPVTAVGDPHQSIYGWRGASAGNLQRFPADFPAATGAPAGVRNLATSWRNDRAVLAAANQISEPLRRPADPAGRLVEVPALRVRDGAGPGRVHLAWHATIEDEVTALADTIESAWRQGSRAAVLCRVRSQFPLVEAALRGRGLPVEVVGLGGLLHVPEVADLRAALEVVHDASRGDSLMRLLTGAAHRIGPRDLDALAAWARVMWQRVRNRQVADEVASRAVLDAAEEISLVEALDALPDPEWSSAGRAISPAGRARLTRLAAVLRRLRRRTALALPELVAEVERALLLDIEVAAVPGRAPAAARVNLDAFTDVAASFAARSGTPRGSAGGSGGGAAGSGAGGSPALGAFLAWLSAAESEERGLDAPLGEVRPDAVQILTVHAAKGLEWDVVAVPGLVEGTFPNGHAGRAPGPSDAWLTDLGALPYPIRGDAAGLPHWPVAAATTQKEVKESLDTFRERCGLHLVGEERRLAYVAITRARSALLLSGAAWGNGVRAREPSRFLVELADLAASSDATADDVGVLLGDWHQVADGEANPREELHRSVSWPIDPLGERRGAVEDAAAAVRTAITELSGDPSERGDDHGWQGEVGALLAERHLRRSAATTVALPRHLSASRMVMLAGDPAALAATVRRPMPRPPSPQARRGSAFHAWLEQRFGAAALVDVDELPGAADGAALDVVGEAELATLQQNFLASSWARRTPYAVEVAVETPLTWGDGDGVDGVTGGTLMLRGRIDAVFRHPDRQDTWEVVDWKTGPPPATEQDKATAAVQLAVYRIAWSALVGVPAERVSAAFFYAATGATVRPVDLLDGEALAALVARAVSGPLDW